MKIKLTLFALFILMLSRITYAQTMTAVSATVTDSDSQAWISGKWTIAMTPGQSNSNILRYTIDGAPVSLSVINQAGTLDSSGNLSVSVYDNTHVAPTGSGWSLSICPNASSPCSTYKFTAIGATMNITAPVTAAITAPRFPGVSGNYGYADVEVITPVATAATYYNVISNSSRMYNGTTWIVPFIPPSGGTITGNLTLTQPSQLLFHNDGLAWFMNQSGTGTNATWSLTHAGVATALNLTNLGDVQFVRHLYMTAGTNLYFDTLAGVGSQWIISQTGTGGAATFALYHGGVGGGINWDAAGNTTAAANLSAFGGTNIVLRCTTAGTLPIGALTIIAGNCGASADTGLRVK